MQGTPKQKRGVKLSPFNFCHCSHRTSGPEKKDKIQLLNEKIGVTVSVNFTVICLETRQGTAEQAQYGWRQAEQADACEQWRMVPS